MITHKVHTLILPEELNEVVAFVPTLHQAFLIPKENMLGIPTTVESDEDPLTQYQEAPDSLFDRSTIVLTFRCNMRCVYCYEDTATPRAPSKVMDWEIVQAVIDHVIQSAVVKTAQGVRTGSVNFFGGEPTMAWETLMRALSYMRVEGERHQVQLRSTINTNGHFVQTKLEQLLPLVDVFTVSIDGPQDIHDALRPTASGGSSFDSVFATAQAIFRAGVAKLQLRTTISQETLGHMPRIVRFFTSHFPGVVQAYEPLQETGRALITQRRSPTMEAFLEQVLQITPVVETAGGTVKISMLDLGNFGSSFCGVNGNNFIITPDGLVTACNRKMSSQDADASKFIFGAYDWQLGAFQFDEHRLEALRSFTIDSIPECRTCFARYACRGGCAAIKADRNSSFWTVPSNYCAAIQMHMTRMLFRSLRKAQIG